MAQPLHDRRKFLMALMYAAGIPLKEIAHRLSYSEGYVTTLASSELFRAQVAELQRDMRDTTISNLLDRVQQEAIPSFNVLMEIRDGAIDDAATARLRLDAAKFHLGDMYMDRFIPKTTRQETEDVIRIQFDQDAVRQMFGTLAEVRGTTITVDSPNVSVTQVALPSPSKPINIATVDEAMDDFDDDAAF